MHKGIFVLVYVCFVPAGARTYVARLPQLFLELEIPHSEIVFASSNRKL